MSLWKRIVVISLILVLLVTLSYSVLSFNINDLKILGMIKAPIWATNHDQNETESWRYAKVIAVDNSIGYDDTINVTVNFTAEFNYFGAVENLSATSLRLYQVDEYGRCFNESGVVDNNNGNNCYAIPLELSDA